MNIQQLRYLVAAADTGSVSGAARAARVSQPVVSRALHDLEREHRITLFQRQGRRLALTDSGLAVVAAARRALEAIDEVTTVARRLASTDELVVVATPTNSALLSPIVTSFVRHHPGTALRLLRAGSMGEVIAMVASGAAELGFGDLGADHGQYPVQIRPLWHAEATLVSPVGSDLPDAVPQDMLGAVPLVLPPAGTERRRMIEETITGDRPTRRPALATDERSAWVSSAQQGLGSFFSYRAVAVELDGVEVRAFAPPIVVDVGFIHRVGRTSAQGRAMIGLAEAGAAPVGCRLVDAGQPVIGLGT